MPRLYGLAGPTVAVALSAAVILGPPAYASPRQHAPPHRLKQARPPPSQAAAAPVVEAPTTTTTEAPAPVPTLPPPSSSATTTTLPSGGWDWPWSCIAAHESGGNPASDTGNGYYGGLQFSLSSWRGAGGPPGLPSSYPIATQEAVANRLLAMQGWGAWPATSALCGL